MTSQSQSQVLDPDRLQELLRPIRELSAVWDFDLSTYLDEYLTNISGIDLSQEFNPETLNFSQAGLLIQGTTNIYAKKVKHLYDLVTSSTAIPENEDNPQKGKKRQRKQIDWVIDDKLAPIDDPDTVDSTVLDTDEPRLEITTMPKIPFCLLHSLDAKTPSGQDKYRINNVPNQKNGVIILDGSQTFADFSVQESKKQSDSDLEPDAVDNMPPPPEDDFEAPPPPDFDEGNDIDNGIPQPDLGATGDQVETEAGDATAEEIPKQKTPKKKKNPKPAPKLLNPDAPNLSIMNHKFKKMAPIKIPTSFGGAEKQRNILKQPFHYEIFAELDEKVRKYREKRKRNESIEALDASVEGREHIISNLDFFEAPPPPSESEDEEMISSQIPEQETQQQYSDICKAMIQNMVDEGRKKTNLTESMKSFYQWENKLNPVLEQERKRKQFDISETRKWIIITADAKGGTITFSNLTSGLMPHEISRVFLSTLFLSNSGDVDIENNKPNEGDFTIKLLRGKDEIIQSLNDQKDTE